MYPAGVSVTLVTLLGIGGVGFLIRAVAPRSPASRRVGDLLLVLLALAMIVMALDANTLFPPIAQLIVFGVGVVFFVILAIVAPRGDRFRLVYRAATMAAMVVMAVQMLQSGTHLDGSMDAPGDQPMTMAASAAWTVVGIVTAAVFGAGALLFLIRLLLPRTGRGAGSGRGEAFLLLAASAGMSLAFIPW